jgi:hypothetical protein
MDVSFEVEGFWYAGEVAGAVESLCGVRPEVSTGEGKVTIHGDALTAEQVEEVREYLAKNPQKSWAERIVEFEEKQEERRSVLTERVLSGIGSSASLSELREAVGALAELVGVVNEYDLEVSSGNGGRVQD